ncbi:MAG: discoidin domain-containing protein, partial [Opitutaceae bacterium]|nr:discoidin domain-containing protein [Opitutaceae bacterium]
MKRVSVLALSLLLAKAMFGAGAPLTPFQARHQPYEPQAPLLTTPEFQDVLRGAKITASGHDDEQRPEFVHDGITDDSVLFWTSKQFPSWVQLELPEAREIAQVNLQLRSPGTVSFSLVIEGSMDGRAWQMLCDRSGGTGVIPAGEIETVLPEAMRLRFLRLTVTGSSKPERAPYVMELSACAKPTPRALAGAVGDINRQYDATNVPLNTSEQAWHGTAWRGERVHGQFLVWTARELSGLRAELSALRRVDGVGRDRLIPPLNGAEGKAGSGDPAL